MIVKRLYEEQLAQASYLIGCGATKQAVVIDPNRDVDAYIQTAAAEGLEITHIAETHIHADFISGARELAERTGAKLYLSDEGGVDWRYAFAADYDAVLLKDGDSFRVGNVQLDAVHTPGHTPEHLSYLVTDTAGADQPIAIATGDFVLVSDVGRPDLLERAAGLTGTMEDGARDLFQSLQWFKGLPDYLQIWPGHGAGSACGKGIGAVPQTTVGYERLFNWAFSIEDEDEFIRTVLRGQPEPPRYFAEMKRINREGPRILGGLRRPQLLAQTQLPGLLEESAIVIDTRHAAEFARGHIPGTINIPLNRSFTTWAGWLIPYDREFYLLLDDRCTHCVDEAAKDLAMIGLDRSAGYFTLDALSAWRKEHGELETVPQLTTAELAEARESGSVEVLDVRGAAEWEAGHIPGVKNIPLGYLSERLDELPQDRPLAVHCQSGGRSAIAASLLQARGFRNVINLPGGFADWNASGRPIESEAESTSEIEAG